MADLAKASQAVRGLGAAALRGMAYVGSMSLLAGQAGRWLVRSVVRPKGRSAGRSLAQQVVRVGVRSAGIIVLVQVFIGVILALQLAPTLDDYGQLDKVANIIGTGGFRILAPIITAVVLSGFAGASIAAELGTMVVGEEIEALEAMGINPVRYLVVPRVLATTVMTVLLSVLADLMVPGGTEGLMNEYRYPGPKPLSKETVMLADAVEAASRTLDDPKPSRIKSFIKKIIDSKLEASELSNSSLTFRELSAIEQSFLQVLISVFHPRVEYPEPIEKTT